MKVETKCEIGDMVVVKNSNEIWKVIALHLSARAVNHCSIIYDLKNQEGRRIISPEKNIQEVM